MAAGLQSVVIFTCRRSDHFRAVGRSVSWGCAAAVDERDAQDHGMVAGSLRDCILKWSGTAGTHGLTVDIYICD